MASALVTSAHMRAHREMFEPVCATEQRSFADFLATQVEAMGVEADEMHVQALTAALGLRVLRIDTGKLVRTLCRQPRHHVWSNG